MEAEIPCKGANAAVPRAKVQMFLKGVGVGVGVGVVNLENRFGWLVTGSIFGSQVSAIGCQMRVVRFGYGCGT